MDKLKNWFFEENAEEYTDDYTEAEPVTEDTVSKTTATKKSLFESAKSSTTRDAINRSSGSNLVLFEPRAYEETQQIAQFLKQGKAAVINLHRLQREQSKRVVDFLSGVIFAIDGDIQRIGPKIFLCTPKNIVVDGEIHPDDDSDKVAAAEE